MATLPAYATREEKEAVYRSCWFCDSENEVRGFLREIEQVGYGKGWAFRGVKRASYKLFTSLQRVWIEKELGNAGMDHTVIVRHLLNAARRMQSMRGNDVPQEIKSIDLEDELGLLSYLQHYDCPTPLLDFSSDIRVALYFATEPSRSPKLHPQLDMYFSIYTFSDDIVGVVNGGLEKQWQKYVEARFLDARRALRSYNVMTAQDTLIYHPTRHDKIYGKDVIPVWNNPRIMLQSGLFASNTTADTPFPEAIQAFIGRSITDGSANASAKTMVNCVNIHRDFAPIVVEWLEKQNPPMNKNYLLPSRPEHGNIPLLFNEVMKELGIDGGIDNGAREHAEINR